ncbi:MULTISPECIES: hypothetical protein [Streptomyces]|uniref:hypothetical protein n=1 Tax=Streptomyces TaxID=1883 RepID=UPI00068ECBAC|nr:MULTISPECIES: hypothetical protein [Streptomyces]MDN3056774.1 hypothetical protein [Streptomyces sp. SRF1]
MRSARTLARAVCATAVLGTTVALGTGPVSAAPAATTASCAYPYVCIQRISDGVIIGRFQDVTSGYQDLPSRPSNVTIINTRHDDVAYIRYANGSKSCVAPNDSLAISGYVLTGIRISSSATCS